MGCGCLVVLLSAVSPRLALFVIWLFTDWMTAAFGSFWLGLAGFVFLPWTTLAYTVAYRLQDGIELFGILLIIFAFIVDLSTHFGASRADYKRQQA